MAFAKNDEIKEIDYPTTLPSLPSEGEKVPTPAVQTQQPNTLKVIEPEPTPTRQLRNIPPVDYRESRPRTKPSMVPKLTIRIPAWAPEVPPDVTRQTESSKAKIRDTTQFALDAHQPDTDLSSEWAFIATEPKDFREAVSGGEEVQWRKAMDEEMRNLEKMGTWELTDLPEGGTPIVCKWVYLKKTDENGNVTKFKAQLVAQGFSQKPGIDYSNNGTFAPVMRFDTLRTVLALTAVNGWDLRQFDIKGAYLNSYIEEEIYMRQPPGFEDGTAQVCKLKRSLYRLKQAGNVWNKELDHALQDLGFQKLRSDSCCYLWEDGDNFEILLVWVDDILSTANSQARNDLIEKQIATKFKIKSLGKPTLLLGMHIIHNPSQHLIKLSQTAYIDALLKKFGMEQANPVSTPLDPNVNLDNFTDEGGVADEQVTASYATLIGSLMYLAIGT